PAENVERNVRVVLLPALITGRDPIWPVASGERVGEFGGRDCFGRVRNEPTRRPTVDRDLDGEPSAEGAEKCGAGEFRPRPAIPRQKPDCEQGQAEARSEDGRSEILEEARRNPRRLQIECGQKDKRTEAPNLDRQNPAAGGIEFAPPVF